MHDIVGEQLRGNLFYDFAGVAHDKHALAIGHGVANDFGGDDGLAGAGRGDQTNLGNTAQQSLPALAYHVELIRAQLEPARGESRPVRLLRVLFHDRQHRSLVAVSVERCDLQGLAPDRTGA